MDVPSHAEARIHSFGIVPIFAGRIPKLTSSARLETCFARLGSLPHSLCATLDSSATTRAGRSKGGGISRLGRDKRLQASLLSMGALPLS